MEAADWLFGVSMGGDGVSKVLSRKLPAAEETQTGARARDRRGRLRPRCYRRAAVARDWSDLFITGEAAARGEAEPTAGVERKRGLLRRLRENLSKTRQALGGELQATLWGTLDEHTWERLEEALIMADVGASTTASVVATLEAEATAGELTGGEALSGAADRAARADRAGRRWPDRREPAPDGDHGGRRQRDGQDDDDRQAGLAPAQRARA